LEFEVELKETGESSCKELVDWLSLFLKIFSHSFWIQGNAVLLTRMLDNHRAKVKIISEEGRGSLFRVAFPQIKDKTSV